MWLQKLEFLYKISKSEHFNDEDIRPVEILEL